MNISNTNNLIRLTPQPTPIPFVSLENLKTALYDYVNGSRGDIIRDRGELRDWDISNITSFQNLFSKLYDASEEKWELLDNIKHWDVSHVTNMAETFSFCKKFNINLNKWNVSNVTTMWKMFFLCEKFN